MKKVLSVLLCAILLFGTFSFSVFAKAESTTEFLLEVDVNERYTDIIDDPDGRVTGEKPEDDSKKIVYIAILSAALVVSVVILAVSVKRVPKEEDIDISGETQTKTDNKE